MSPTRKWGSGVRPDRSTIGSNDYTFVCGGLAGPFGRFQQETRVSRRRGFAKPLLPIDAQDAELHLSLDIEEVDLFGPEPVE
jgi:hypothetical protein